MVVPLRCQFASLSGICSISSIQTFVKRLFNGMVNGGEWAFDVGKDGKKDGILQIC